MNLLNLKTIMIILIGCVLIGCKESNDVNLGSSGQDAAPDVVIFKSSDSLIVGGSIGSRTNADSICDTATDRPDSSIYSNVKALITYSGGDAISDFPIESDKVVKGPTGLIISNSWSDFLNPSIDFLMTLEDAQVASTGSDTRFWTGSEDDGSYTTPASSQTCNDWVGSNPDQAPIARLNLTDDGLKNGYGFCDSSFHLLCIAY